MRKSWVSGGLLILALAIALPAFCFSLGGLIGNRDSGEHLKLIHVQDLARMMTAPDGHVYLYDANPPDVRQEYGVIPGAKLLPSAGGYNLAMLPPDKRATLVFYCHNWL